MKSKIIEGLELSPNGQPEQYPEETFARKCDKCSKVFNKGFVIGGGEEYYCSEKCLYQVMTKEELIELLKEISANIQEKVKKNEILRVEIEEYFDNKLKEVRE